jgi:serine/threonine-protein kinase
MLEKIKRKHLLGASISVGVFIAGALILFLLFDFAIMPLVVKGGAETMVPDVINLSQQAAEARLTDSGLEFVIGDEEFDSERPKGTVINQRPDGGAVIKKGRHVILTISKGSASATVPYLTGYSLREARFILEKEGLQPGNIHWLTDEDKPDGVILGSSPEEGTVMKLNAEVQLMVNRVESQQLIPVPDFTGMDLDQAEITAEENFLLIGELGYEARDNLLPETVVSQSFPPGTEVPKWTVVDLTISLLE